jgi:hypothetical protein
MFKDHLALEELISAATEPDLGLSIGGRGKLRSEAAISVSLAYVLRVSSLLAWPSCGVAVSMMSSRRTAWTWVVQMSYRRPSSPSTCCKSKACLCWAEACCCHRALGLEAPP